MTSQSETTARSSRPAWLRLGVAAKLAALLVAFGLVPATLVLLLLLSESDSLARPSLLRLREAAITLNDIVDRNLFERYGDVQAFTENAAAKSRDTWGKPGGANPLVAAMDAYMTNYGVYRLMLVLDDQGRVQAANSVRGDGKPLDTAALYGRDFSRAPWFTKARNGEFLIGKTTDFTGTAVGEPEAVPEIAGLYGDDGLVIAFSAPIKDAAGQIIGVWVNFADFGLVENIVDSFGARLAEDGLPAYEIYVTDKRGQMLIDHEPSTRGRDGYRRDLAALAHATAATRDDAVFKAAQLEPTGAMVVVDPRDGGRDAAGFARSAGAYGYPGLGWVAMVRMPAADAFAAIERTLTELKLVIAASLAGLTVIGIAAGIAAALPIRRLTRRMTRLAQGELAGEIPSSGSRDEIGDMARALAVFQRNMMENQRLEAEAAAGRERETQLRVAQEEEARRRMEERLRQEQAQHELDQQLQQQKLAALEAEQQQRERRAAEERAAAEDRARRAAAMESLVADFEQVMAGVLGTLGNAAERMTTAAAAITDMSRETNGEAEKVADAARRTDSNLQTVASASEELSASIGEIGRQISGAASMAGEAVAQSEGAGTQIRRLDETAREIGQVVELIRSIAGQTNLLALNATIEAARAGEAGKGFAVVAAEVKNLATQTSKATADIADQITSVQQSVSDTVATIGGIGATIGRLNEAAITVASAVEQQAAATSEIASNVNNAAGAVGAVTNSTVQVVSSAGRSADAAGAVSDASREVAAVAEALREQVLKFLGAVKRAGERRVSDRIRVDLAIAVRGIDGGHRLTELSTGGARVAPALPLPAGAAVDLTIAAHGLRLPGRVVGLAGGETRVQFLLDDRTAEQVEALIERLDRRPAA